MDPVRYPGQENVEDELYQPELMDECANLEPPPMPRSHQYAGPIDAENSVSSGYISDPPFHPHLINRKLSLENMALMDLISKRYVRFSDEIPPALKRRKYVESPSPKREFIERVPEADVSMEETQVLRPSLMRSATVPSASPMLTESTTSLKEPTSLLPVVKTSTHGTELVSIHTVARLVRGEYESRNVTHTIIDCRYPYEYEAGHIIGAINLFTGSDVVKGILENVPAVSFNEGEGFVDLGPKVQELMQGQNPAVRLPTVRGFTPLSLVDDSESEDELTEERRLEAQKESFEISSDVPLPEPDPNALPTHVLIFHCEFSSQRGPELSRFLRKVDRYINYPRYPFVFYPHIYVMMGGYAAFYEHYPHLCEPRNYLKMFDKAHRSDLHYYSKLTKEVSNTCAGCFKDSSLVNLRISPSRREKEKRPPLRSVQTMLPSSQYQKIEDLQNVVKTSPTRSVSREYLQLVEHIIRKGQHIQDTYESIRNATKEGEEEFVFAPSPIGPFSGKRPVPVLRFSSDEDTENQPLEPPFGSRPPPVLNFSDMDEST